MYCTQLLNTVYPALHDSAYAAFTTYYYCYLFTYKENLSTFVCDTVQ